MPPWVGLLIKRQRLLTSLGGHCDLEGVAVLRQQRERYFAAKAHPKWQLGFRIDRATAPVDLEVGDHHPVAAAGDIEQVLVLGRFTVIGITAFSQLYIALLQRFDVSQVFVEDGGVIGLL